MGAPFVIDHATGELVEFSSYMAYGATDSDYRPGRWASFREPYKFGGKEADVEVGLAYFGARYLSLGLGRWISADRQERCQVQAGARRASRSE